MTARLRGATIIEVLTAVAIFSIAVIALFGSFTLSVRLTQHSREIAIASTVAEEKIEQLRLNGFDAATLNSNPSAVSTTKLPQGFTKTFVETYQGNDKIKQVTVKVYWKNRTEAQAITLITLIGQGGING